MNRKMSYGECLKFIREKLGINLFNYQKQIIKCFCEGTEIRTCRGAGRTMCADAFGKYIAYLYSENNYNIEPDVVIPYQEVVKSGLIKEYRIEECRKYMPQEVFEQEFCSK